MSTALPTPSPPEGSWMITEEYTGARQMLSLALDEKRSSPPKDAAETYIYGGPGAHLMMLTTIERIYLLAPTISEEDLLDYLGFVEASMYILAEHHKLEEDFIFPEIDRITDTKLWTAVRDEHSLFVPQFTALWHYARHIRSLLSQPNPSDVPEPYTPISDIPLSAKKYLNLDDNEKGWDGLSVQKHLDSFMTDFMKHIRLEHETSSLENVRQAKEADVAALDKALKMRAFKSGNLHVYVPLFFTNMTKEDVKTFAIANPIMRRLLLPWWFGTRHAGWWRFSAYPEQLTWAGSAV